MTTFGVDIHGCETIEVEAVWPHEDENDRPAGSIGGTVTICAKARSEDFSLTLYSVSKETVERIQAAFGAPNYLHTATNTYRPREWAREREEHRRVQAENEQLKAEVERLKAAGREYAAKLEEALGFTKPAREIEAERSVRPTNEEPVRAMQAELHAKFAQQQQQAAEAQQRAEFMAGPNEHGEWR